MNHQYLVTKHGTWETKISMVVPFVPLVQPSEEFLRNTFRGIGIQIHKCKNGKSITRYFKDGKRITAKEAREWGVRLVWKNGKHAYQIAVKT